jgi:hypothetical protein
MCGKLNDIRETSSNATQIIRELKNPDVHASLDRAKDIAATARDIIEFLKDPSMVKNIENLRLSLESIERISSRIESLRSDTENAGLMDEISNTIKASRKAIETIGNEGSTKELISALKELISEFRSTVSEVNLLLHTVRNSNQEGPNITKIIDNAKETLKYTSSIQQDLKEKS